MTRGAAVAVGLLLVVSAAGLGPAAATAGQGSTPDLAGPDRALDAADPNQAPVAADAAPNATIEHEGDRLTLAAAGGQVVRGTTTLESGSEVAVQLRSTGGEHPFTVRKWATVQSDGAFAVVFGLDDVDPGSNFTATVHGPDGDRLVDGLPGRLVEGEPELGLADSRVRVRTSETATLPLVLDSGASTTLTVADANGDYELTATVTDGDGDGTVTVQFDTAVAGTDGDSLATSDPADEVELGSETVLDSALPDGRYTVSMTHEGVDLDVGSVTVEDPSTTATPTATPETPPSSGPPQVDDTITTGYAGGTVELVVLLGDADAATLSIGGEAVNYVVNATVGDGSGDDRVVVRFDTRAAGTEAVTLSAADDADEVTVAGESDLESSPLDPAEYPVSVYRGEAASGDAVDVATIILMEPEERSPAPTPTPTPSDTSTATTSPTVSATTDSSVDLGVLALGGVAALGLGAAAVLTRRRRWT